MEEWRDIEGYEGLYQVSDTQKVKSLGRFEDGHYWNGEINASYYRKEKILKQKTDLNGYSVVVLYKNKKPKAHFVHDLIAKAFIPNQNNYPFIDHIDGNPSNNSINNLRWCTQKMNMNNPITRKRLVAAKTELNGRKVVCLKNGVVVKEFPSINEAAKFFNMKTPNSIGNCLRGKAKTAYGFEWRYAV